MYLLLTATQIWIRIESEGQRQGHKNRYFSSNLNQFCKVLQKMTQK